MGPWQIIEGQLIVRGEHLQLHCEGSVRTQEPPPDALLKVISALRPPADDLTREPRDERPLSKVTCTAGGFALQSTEPEALRQPFPDGCVAGWPEWHTAGGGSAQAALKLWKSALGVSSTESVDGAPGLVKTPPHSPLRLRSAKGADCFVQLLHLRTGVRQGRACARTGKRAVFSGGRGRGSRRAAISG